MRLLYVSQYFPPEMGAPSARVSQFSRRWREAGHDARVLTGFPNHPGGQIYPGYRGRWWRGFVSEEHEGVPVYRTWLYPAANQGKIRRSLNYASFCVSASLAGALLDFQPEVVIGTSPQLLCALAASFIARRRHARFVLEVRDLWPESLLAVKACTSDSVLYRSLDRVARRLYREASKIVLVSDEFHRALEARGLDPARLAVVKNGVDTEKFRPDVVPAACPEWAGKFIVSYIGTLGMAHSVTTILQAAELLRARDDIQFVIIGNGAERENLGRERQERGLENVTILDQQPWDAIPGFLARSDASIVHLARAPLFETVLPSKMFEIMAAGRPVLLGVRGEAARLVSDAGAGLLCEPESPAELAAAVTRLAADPALCHRLGASGRDYALRYCSYRARAAEYLDLLSSAQPAHRVSEPVATHG